MSVHAKIPMKAHEIERSWRLWYSNRYGEMPCMTENFCRVSLKTFRAGVRIGLRAGKVGSKS